MGGKDWPYNEKPILLQPNTEKLHPVPQHGFSRPQQGFVFFHSIPLIHVPGSQCSNSPTDWFLKGWLGTDLPSPAWHQFLQQVESADWAGSWLYTPTQKQRDSGSWCPTFIGKFSVEQGELWTSTALICNEAVWVSAPLLPRWRCRTQRESKHPHPASHMLNLNRGLPAKRQRRWNRIQSLICSGYIKKIISHSRTRKNDNMNGKSHLMDANNEIN